MCVCIAVQYTLTATYLSDTYVHSPVQEMDGNLTMKEFSVVYPVHSEEMLLTDSHYNEVLEHTVSYHCSTFLSVGPP